MLNNLDLNLLRVFDAMMRERSVLRAGHRVGLSQSAVSHALGRLRDYLKDDLFIRAAQSMEPTPRAIEMGPLVRDALIALEQAVSPPLFDPSRAARSFHIAATDYITQVVIPPLLQDLAVSAPGIDLFILPATRLDLATQIDFGRVDLAIGNFSVIPPRLRSSLLFSDCDALTMAARHPLAKRKVTIEDLSHFALMAVAVGGADDGITNGLVSERGLSRRSEMFDRGAIETAFAQQGLTPRFSVLLPHFLALPGLVQHSDRVAILPRRLADAFSGGYDLLVKPTPWIGADSGIQMVWHERGEREPAQRWLRQRVKEASRFAEAKAAPV